MKTFTPVSTLLRAGLFSVLTGLLAPCGYGQGVLTPPGAPAPTMKTLDQIEARTIVNATNTPGDATNSFIISKSGSYYLTGNITGVAGKNGISIQAGDVTLDLNGFTLTGPGTGGDETTGLRGVVATAEATNSCIRNGSARNWYSGVDATAAGMLVEKLRLYGNITGLNLSNGSIVRDCVATGNTTGFKCGDRNQLSNCIATENAGVGFDCQYYVSLFDCTASRNFGQAGIKVWGSCSIIRCNASRNNPSGSGIIADVDCTITDCTASNNSFYGIIARESTVTNCTAAYNEKNGISATESSVAYCTASHNTRNGITANDGIITSSTATYNGYNGIDAVSSSIANCRASDNADHGIDASSGSITNCRASANGRSGILASQASLMNCVAMGNGDHGINGFTSVIAFCRATGNNRNNNGSVEIYGPGATLTGNNDLNTP